MNKQMRVIKTDPAKNWNDVELHKQLFGHLPDEECGSGPVIACERLAKPTPPTQGLAEEEEKS